MSVESTVTVPAEGAVTKAKRSRGTKATSEGEAAPETNLESGIDNPEDEFVEDDPEAEDTAVDQAVPAEGECYEHDCKLCGPACNVVCIDCRFEKHPDAGLLEGNLLIQPDSLGIRTVVARFRTEADE